MTRHALAVAATLLLVPMPAAAQSPPPPVAPEVVRRDDTGRASLRAVRTAQPLDIDGVLDEAFYRETPSISDFRQLEPSYGQPATERTEVWIAFDDDNVYVTFRCWDSDIDAPGRDRDAPRLDGDVSRQRRGVVHLRSAVRSPELDRLHHQPAGRPLRRPGRQRAAVQQRLEPGLVAARPAASTAAGRSRRRFRSSRCATRPATRRSGASTRCG